MVDVYLHEGIENDPGWRAWSLDHLGMATWAPTRAAVLERFPPKLREYSEWLARHETLPPSAAGGSVSVRVVEEVRGDEILFSPDREPATSEEIGRCLRLLGYSRSDLLQCVESSPPAALDWDPPYERFASWASWRTVRQILHHLANTEVGYYLASIGCAPDPLPPDSPDWQRHLSVWRTALVERLTALSSATDRICIASRDGEEWSVRKVLRRLVRHELLHWKSIRRILAAYSSAEQRLP